MRLVWLVIPFILFIIIGIQESFAEEFEFIASPRHQLESGIAPENIQCREDHVLVLRINGNPACVFEKTADKMNWKIIKTFDISTTIPTSKVIELNLVSPVEFVDDGREIQRSILQKAPAPWPMYDRIMDSMDDGVSVNSDGVASVTSSPHEKYSINSGVGFYAEDWMPEYIPDGQKLLYTETICYEKTGDCRLGIHFVPTTFVLHENVTSFDLQVSKGFIISVKYSGLPLEEIEDSIEHVKEIRDAQPQNYGPGFVDMEHDGKTVYAYEGGNALNHYRVVLNYHLDDHTSIGFLSYYHTLDELIPIFESIVIQ